MKSNCTRRFSVRLALTTLALLGGVACNTSSQKQPEAVRPVTQVGELGLQAEYFSKRGFAGPVLRQTDGQLAFKWGRSVAAYGLVPGNLSARWSGQLTAPKTGSYTLLLTEKDGVGRLWLDGREVSSGETVQLKAGQPVALKAEFEQRGQTPEFKLEWSGRGLPRQIIPIGRFSHPAGLTGQNVATGTVPRDQNLLISGDFEASGSSWTYGFMRENGPTGQAALLSDGGYLQQNQPREAVEIGAVYTLSADAKSSSTEACTIGIAYFSADGTVSKKQLEFGAVSPGTWKSASMDFTIPVSTYLTAVYLQSHEGSCSFDNVDLRIKGEAEPQPITSDWLKFSDFEGDATEVVDAWNTKGSIVSPGANGSEQALQDRNGGWSQQNIATELITTLKAGEPYTLQATGRALNGSSCMVGFRGGTNTEILFSKILDFRGDEWATHKVMGSLPKGTMWGAVYLASGEKECQFDDVRIGSVTTDTGFESTDPADGESIGPDMTYGSPIALEFPVFSPGDTAYFDIYGLGDDAYLGSDFQWDFGDGTTASGEAVQHDYKEMGTYTVTLNYKDGEGQPKSYSTQVAAINIADVVSSPATSDSMTVTFDAGPEIPGISYEWDFGDGTKVNGAKQQHEYAELGTYTYTLKMKDYRGQQSSLTSQGLAAQTDTASDGGREIFKRKSFHTIWQRPPEAKIKWTGSDEPNAPIAVIQPGQSSATFTFDATASKDDVRNFGAGNLTYKWDFGDGTTSTEAVVEHTYTETKPFLVTLTVTNEMGLSATTKRYFHVRDFRYNTRLYIKYAGGNVVDQSLSSQALDPDVALMNGEGEGLFMGSELQSMNVAAPQMTAQSYAPTDADSYAEIPYVLPARHNIERGIHRPIGATGATQNVLCTPYKLFVDGEDRSGRAMKAEVYNSVSSPAWISPFPPIVIPENPKMCYAMIFTPGVIGRFHGYGWKEIYVASIGMNVTRANVMHELSVPRLIVSVLPDELIEGKQASPVITEEHMVNPETGEDEYIVRVKIRESESKHGKVKFKVPVMAVDDKGRYLKLINGDLHARFTKYSTATEPVAMVDGRAEMEVEINPFLFGEEGEQIDLRDITYFSSNGDCGRGINDTSKVSKHYLQGCLQEKATYQFPNKNAPEDIPEVPAYLQKSYVNLFGRTVYGKDARDVALSMRKTWDESKRAALEDIDNFIPILIVERVGEYRDAVAGCMNSGDCSLKEAGGLVLQGLFLGAEVAPGIGKGVSKLDDTASTLGREIRKNLDEAVPNPKLFDNIDDLMLKTIGPNVVRGLAKCNNKSCVEDLDEAANALVKGGYSDKEALNIFDLELYDIQQRNKLNDYKLTPPENFKEARWRSVCRIGGNSFAPDTLVHAAQGFFPISQLKINDKVLAYNEATQQNGYYPITAVHRHMDDSITTLQLQTEDGQFETLTTTPEHPFYVTIKAGNGIRPLPIGHEGLNEHWVGAGHLLIGDKLRLADGRVGEVRNVTTEAKTLEMFNLTVEQAHTFYVGTQGWLVHNCQHSWKPGEDLAHYEKHGHEIVQALGLKSYSLSQYIEDAKIVIKNGIFVPEMNAYVQIIGGKGSAKVLIVGIDRNSNEITTMHVKSVREIIRRAPSLGWIK